VHLVGDLRRFLRSRARWDGLGIGLVVTATGAIGRWWVRNGGDPIFWNDSADYVTSASTGLLSTARLVGGRPILMPLVLSVAQLDQQRFTVLQAAVAALSWGVLAAVVAVSTRSAPARATGVVGVLVLSLTWPVSMWDEQILTESLALSTLALVAASALWFSNRPSPRRAVALVVTCGLWLVARDSHAVPVALGGLVLVALAARPRAPRQLLALTGAYLVALSFLVAGSAQAGERNLQPLEHVYAARVLPYADRVSWFEAHGMPQARELEAIPEALDPVHAVGPFTPVPPEARWAPWRAWLEDEGQATFLRYVATHPAYLVTETQARPERVFNNGDGLPTYEPRWRRDVPGVRWFATVDTDVVVAVWATALLLVLLARDERRPLVAVGAFLGASSLPHALAVWHLDGMESARHLLIPGIQLRIGTVLVLAAAADTVVAKIRGTGRSRPARSPDHPPARTPRRA